MWWKGDLPDSTHQVNPSQSLEGAITLIRAEKAGLSAMSQSAPKGVTIWNERRHTSQVRGGIRKE